MKTIFTITFCLLICCLKAQSNHDFAFARSAVTHTHKESFTFDVNYKNELVAVTNILFVTYKYFISSQDQTVCVFHPSCSVYAMECVKHKGFVRGIMGAFDRMSRCHGLNLDQYPIHPETGQAYDPIEY